MKTRWYCSVFLSLIASVTGLIAVPIAIGLGWPRTLWAVWGNDDGFLTDYEDPFDPELIKQKSFWEQFYWFGIRNRAHNFSRLLGVDVLPDPVVAGDPATTEQGHEGWRLVEQADGAYEYYRVKKLWFGLCFRKRVGWALHNEKPGRRAGLKHHISIRRFGPAQSL